MVYSRLSCFLSARATCSSVGQSCHAKVRWRFKQRSGHHSPKVLSNKWLCKPKTCPLTQSLEQKLFFLGKKRYYKTNEIRKKSNTYYHLVKLCMTLNFPTQPLDQNAALEIFSNTALRPFETLEFFFF